MAINSEIADGLDELEADFPATFVWNSTSYTCLAGAESRAVSAGEFGLEPMDSLTLVVQLDQFGSGAKPAERNKITFNSGRDGDYEIFVMNADGSNVVSLGQQGYSPSWAR